MNDMLFWLILFAVGILWEISKLSDSLKRLEARDAPKPREVIRRTSLTNLVVSLPIALLVIGASIPASLWFYYKVLYVWVPGYLGFAPRWPL